MQVVGCWTKIGRCAQENARACHLIVLLCMGSEGPGGVGDEEEEQEEKHFEQVTWCDHHGRLRRKRAMRGHFSCMSRCM